MAEVTDRVRCMALGATLRAEIAHTQHLVMLRTAGGSTDAPAKFPKDLLAALERQVDVLGELVGYARGDCGLPGGSEVERAVAVVKNDLAARGATYKQIDDSLGYMALSVESGGGYDPDAGAGPLYETAGEAGVERR